MNSGPSTNLLGGCIRIRTTFSDEPISGEVFSCDRGSNNLVLKEGGDGNYATFRIIKISSIQAIISAESRPPAQQTAARLPFIDLQKLEEGQKRAIDDFMKHQQHTIGVGVSREAQDLFNFIHKTHPDCHWEGTSIVVLGVKIMPPYFPENCFASGGDERSVERIKKVIHGHHARSKRKAPQAHGPHSRASANSSQQGAGRGMRHEAQQSDPPHRPTAWRQPNEVVHVDSSAMGASASPKNIKDVKDAATQGKGSKEKGDRGVRAKNYALAAAGDTGGQYRGGHTANAPRPRTDGGSSSGDEESNNPTVSKSRSSSSSGQRMVPTSNRTTENRANGREEPQKRARKRLEEGVDDEMEEGD